jgi:osmotically-inducible protein OsmY
MKTSDEVIAQTLREAVVRELASDPAVDADRVDVLATDGAITLSGHASSYEQKLAAVRAVERVYGVTAIADEIEVRLPPSSERDDIQIAEAIARERRWSALIPMTVKVEVTNGHVTLRGEVEWLYQRSETEHALRHLAGVRGMTNLIEVKSGPILKRPDAGAIKQRVEAAIAQISDAGASSIRVTASEGTVHIRGHVRSFAERRIAEEAAEAAPGVAVVDNELDVKP